MVICSISIRQHAPSEAIRRRIETAFDPEPRPMPMPTSCGTRLFPSGPLGQRPHEPTGGFGVATHPGSRNDYANLPPVLRLIARSSDPVPGSQ